MTASDGLSQSVLKNGVRLALFSLICIGTVAIINQFARPQIENNALLALQASLQEVLPADTHDNNLLSTTYAIQPNPLLANSVEKTAYVATKNKQPVAVILPVTAPEGYGGSIQLIVAIYSNGRIAGVRVVPPHAETPGLGDAIEIKKSRWILSFNEKSLTEPAEKNWAVKKDGGVFDAFTGATITPRAVVSAVHNALLYFEQNKQLLFSTTEKSPLSERIAP